ncbi:DUF4012 domain-containing protein [Candidatus Microgenomates bacterium]|nr:DUF4012 domain-containing protein [Candidatus Microgenomates bacterium]
MPKKQDPLAENLLADENIDLTDASTSEVGQAAVDVHLGGVDKQMDTVSSKASRFRGKLPKIRGRKPFLIVSVVIIGLLLLITLPGFFVVQAFTNVRKSSDALVESFKAQDFPAVNKNIDQLDRDLAGLDGSMNFYVWTRFLPVVGSYYKDAKSLVVAGREGLGAAKVLVPAIEPYADVLGFNGAAPTDGSAGAKTAEERIDFIVDSLPAIIPKLDEVSPRLKKAREAVAGINPGRYPEKIAGKSVRKPLADIVELIKTSATIVTDGKPLLEAMPYILGVDSGRTYLVIFQNDKELRPTGGFMTGYSLMKVKDGKMEPVSSDDIYNLDKRYKAHIEAPKPFRDHIKQPYSANPNWRLRDMNWSPDFKATMDLFLAEAKTAKLPQIDGVIAVDTNLLVSILEITGQIGVPGQGNFSAEIDKRCDCPQVIYELESYADVEKAIVWDPNTGKIVFGEIVDNRKAILGPLVNSVVSNALAQPKEKVPSLFNAFLNNVQQKHVMFYMFDEKTQKAVEAFNVAGRIRETDGDYLAIIDANLGGRKSNLYVTQEVEDTVSVSGDKVKHELVITYKNPQKHDGWLNSVLPNYMRVYVPRGAKLIDGSGVTGEVETVEDLDKTVFQGFFELRPEGVVKVNITYEVSKRGTDGYKYLIQQQPGKLPSHYVVNFGRDSEEFQLSMDRELQFK